MAPTAAAGNGASSSDAASDMLRVEGVVKLAYPLQQLLPRDAHVADSFTLGDGPCGEDATQVMTVMLENECSFESSVVFFYDVWAERMRFLQRHVSANVFYHEYKVRIQGRGLVMSFWDVGSDDTEDRQSCYVVAERHLLKRALERSARLFALPKGMSVEVTYAEPQRVPGVDQLHYLPPKSIHAHDLRPDLKTAVTPSLPLTEKPSRQNARGKRTLQQAAGVYTYTCLGDLVCGRASIYGVVVNMSLPKKTRGTDYSMTVHVIDESCPERRHALQIVIFYPKIDQMPRVLFVGDIIRFHRLDVKRFQENLQGVSYPKFTRHLVIRENEQTGELQQITCSETWTFDDLDRERVGELLKWSKQGLRTDTTFLPGYPQPPNLLSDPIFSGTFVDIVVRVLYVSRRENDSTRTRVIVWDGSGDATLSESSCTKVLENSSIEIPTQGLLKEIVFDSCWGLLQDLGFADKLLSHWCRFRNLAFAEDDAGTFGGKAAATLRFREGASLMFVPEYVRDVQARLEIVSLELDMSPPHEDEEEQQQVVESIPTQEKQTWTLVPEYIRNDVPVTSLLQVQNSEVVPRKYHCLARFTTIWPADVAKLTKLQPRGKHGEYIYSFAVRLEDDSGSIDVIVYGKDAEHFLRGIPACDLTTSTSSRIVLEKKLAGLLKSSHLQHCCVKSYYPPSAAAAASVSSDSAKTKVKARAASVRYRLFDTLLQ